jgi:hypothetical protein
MRRITSYQYTELIQAALACYPEHIRQELEKVDILTGVDPERAGLCESGKSPDGRWFGDTWHVIYDAHQTWRPWNERRVTIALPVLPRRNGDITDMVHEFAHVLDHRLKFLFDLPPVTKYAQTDRYEAFAEGICDHIFWGYANLDVRSGTSPVDRDPWAQAILRELWRGDMTIWEEDRLWG